MAIYPPIKKLFNWQLWNEKINLSNVPKYVEIDVTSQQLLNDIGSGIEVVPAPGLNKYVEIEKAIFEFTPGSVTYDSNGNSYLYLTDFNTNGQVVNISVVLNIVKVYSIAKKGAYISSADNVSYEVDNVLNQPCYLSTWNGTNLTLGNGSLKLKVWYYIHNFS